MIHLIGPYRCTDQLSVWYVPSFTELYQVYQHMVHGSIPMYRPYRSPVRLVHTAHIERYVTVLRTLIFSSWLIGYITIGYCISIICNIFIIAGTFSMTNEHLFSWFFLKCKISWFLLILELKMRALKFEP